VYIQSHNDRIKDTRKEFDNSCSNDHAQLWNAVVNICLDAVSYYKKVFKSSSRDLTVSCLWCVSVSDCRCWTRLVWKKVVDNDLFTYLLTYLLIYLLTVYVWGHQSVRATLVILQEINHHWIYLYGRSQCRTHTHTHTLVSRINCRSDLLWFVSVTRVWRLQIRAERR